MKTASEVKNSNRTRTLAHETRKNRQWLSMFVIVAFVVSVALASCGGRGSGNKNDVAAEGKKFAKEICDCLKKPTAITHFNNMSAPRVILAQVGPFGRNVTYEMEVCLRGVLSKYHRYGYLNEQNMPTSRTFEDAAKKEFEKCDNVIGFNLERLWQ